MKSKNSPAPQRSHAVHGSESSPIPTGDSPRVSEDIVSKVFHLSPDAMCVTSFRSGRILALNDSFEQMFGHTRQDALGKTIPELGLWVCPSERERLLDRLSRGGNIHEVDFEFESKSGVRRRGLMSATIVEAGGERFAISITKDITETRRHAHALRASEEQLRLALDAAQMGTWNWEIRTRTVTWSDNIEAMFRMPSGSFPGTIEAYREIIHPDDRGRVEQRIQQALESGEDYEVEHRALRADGTVMWLHGKGRVFFDGGGEPLRMTGTVSDITQRKLAEARLEVTQFSIDHAGDAVFWVRSDASIAYVNETACRWFGYTREELQSLRAYDLDVQLSSENWSDFWARIVAAGSLHTETESTRKDGSQFSVELNLSFFDFNGQEYVTCFVRDLTERKLADKALLDSQAQLQQAQKMEAFGLLAGGVAHDFNNILTIIGGYSDLILGNGRVDGATRTRVAEIAKASERAASLTRQLLAFSRRQVLQPEVVDLRDVLVNMETMLSRIIGEDIELECSFADRVGRVRADPGQIEQVIMNLAVNARDAMRFGGRLTLETHDVTVTEDFAETLPGLKPGAYAQLAITDSGDGIAENLLPRIFEPFFTTKERGRGTGLGLSTAYGIVKQSGGYIYASNAEGGGAQFKIFLPTVGDLPARIAAPDDKPTKRAIGTILLVEDDEAIRDMAVEILAAEGYVMLDAADGEEALRLLESAQKLIDLMVTDVVMPKMNGVQLGKRVRQRFPDIKLLYMSGYTDETILPLGVNSSGNVVLQKPFTGRELVDKVERLMAASATAAQTLSGPP